MSEALNMSNKQVIETPKETVLDGVVIDVVKTTWSEIISPDKISKFEKPEEEIALIKFETQFDGKTLKGEESFKYYEKPMSNSKLGSFLIKYQELKPGIKIKVDYNSEGFPSIRIK